MIKSVDETKFKDAFKCLVHESAKLSEANMVDLALGGLGWKRIQTLYFTRRSKTGKEVDYLETLKPHWYVGNTYAQCQSRQALITQLNDGEVKPANISALSLLYKIDSEAPDMSIEEDKDTMKIEDARRIVEQYGEGN